MATGESPRIPNQNAGDNSADDRHSHTILYQRVHEASNQNLPTGNEAATGHTHPYSIPRDNQQRLSDNLQPVVEGQPNDEDVELQYLRLSALSTSDGSSFQELELSRGSSQFSGSHNLDCAACRLLMAKIHCDDTKQFWREIDHEGPDFHQSCHIKFFEKFLERMLDKFPQEQGLKSKCTINLLKYLLKVELADKTAGVKLADIQRVVELFGPIKLQDGNCVLMSQLHQIIKKSLKARERDKRVKTSWFAGDLTRDEAEKYLMSSDCKDKTYLVRISSTDGSDGDFVLSVRHDDHCHHLKIQGDPKKALSESPYNAHLVFGGQEFTSLPDVVDYIIQKQDIEIDQEDDSEDGESCKSVTCLRVFSKSPLNGPMSGYEKSKR